MTRKLEGINSGGSLVRNAARNEDFALIAPAAQLPRPDGIRERRNGLRADARACGGAARGRGAAQATEPGCGAEPHVSRHEPSAHRDGGNGCIIGGTAAGTEVAYLLGADEPV